MDVVVLTNSVWRPNTETLGIKTEQAATTHDCDSAEAESLIKPYRPCTADRFADLELCLLLLPYIACPLLLRSADFLVSLVLSVGSMELWLYHTSPSGAVLEAGSKNKPT